MRWCGPAPRPSQYISGSKCSVTDIHLLIFVYLTHTVSQYENVPPECLELSGRQSCTYLHEPDIEATSSQPDGQESILTRHLPTDVRSLPSRSQDFVKNRRWQISLSMPPPAYDFVMLILERPQPVSG